MNPLEIEDRLLVAGLKQLIPDVARTGVNILIEPLTKKETHYMNLQRHGAEIISEAERQVSGCSPTFTTCRWKRRPSQGYPNYGRHTAHVHLADGEKRTEPGSFALRFRPAERSNGGGSRLAHQWRAGQTDNAEDGPSADRSNI
jgi:hypothetical protein